MDCLNSLGAATGTGNVLRLLIHRLDLDCKFVKFTFLFAA